jgi:hypothetical protein
VLSGPLGSMMITWWVQEGTPVVLHTRLSAVNVPTPRT